MRGREKNEAGYYNSFENIKYQCKKEKKSVLHLKGG